MVAGNACRRGSLGRGAMRSGSLFGFRIPICAVAFDQLLLSRSDSSQTSQLLVGERDAKQEWRIPERDAACGMHRLGSSTMCGPGRFGSSACCGCPDQPWPSKLRRARQRIRQMLTTLKLWWRDRTCDMTGKRGLLHRIDCKLRRLTP